MNARSNPFRVSRIEALSFRFAGEDWDTLWRRLERHFGRGAIVGPNGAGKTTLMLELARQLSDRGMEVRLHRLSLENRELPPGLLRGLAPRHALLLDSAGCISLWDWCRVRWLARQAGVFVVTSHRETLLPTLCTCHTTPELLGNLVCELTGHMPAELGVHVHDLWTRHEGNLREALRELYDQWPQIDPARARLVVQGESC
jgi:energy-coupling factor transporter ATP-binding protein EcfA2